MSDRKVSSRVELKVAYQGIALPRDKSKKSISANTKVNGKIMKPFTLETISEDELYRRVNVAMDFLKDGKTDNKAIIQKYAKEQVKPQIAEITKLHQDELSKIKGEMEAMRKENDALIAQLSEALSQPVKPTKKTVKAETTSQPIKPTKPKKK